MRIFSKKDRIWDTIIVIFCIFLILICLLPMLHVLARSLSSADALIRGQVTLVPVGLNLDAYRTVLSDPVYVRALLWTVVLTLISTAASMIMTILCAYPLIFPNLKGRRFITGYIILTMYLNAGTIPNYLLMKDLNLIGNPLVLILPGVLSVFNMIIMRSFFYGIPDSLRESAEIDGAGYGQILMRIYLPLSTPVLATLTLFYAVGRWNGFSDALMFMNDRRWYPIQLLLYNILNNIMAIEVQTQEGFSSPGLSETLKSATVIFATVPILLVYPWLQRYFISGVTLGAIKE